MDWLADALERAKEWELRTWAGVVNILGMFAILQLHATVGISEKAMYLLARLIEGSRVYRARKRGFKYTPVVKAERPAPAQTPLWKTVLIVGGYVTLCITLIGAIITVDSKLL